MNPRAFAIGGIVTAIAATLSTAGFADCVAQSGPNTAALVELYTSEGCSSCPPADRQLSRLRQALDPNAIVVPLSLHVDYWDYIGWSDPYAQREFAQRQRWLAGVNRQGVVYTPHFFVSGTELQSWLTALPGEVRRLNAKPAEAHIRIEANPAAADGKTLTVAATAQSPNDHAELYLAVAENALVSKVTRGENGGVTLAHDHVVRVWIGPIPLAGGEARVRREIVLRAPWNPAQLEVVGFVEDGRSGKVLQAVVAQQCVRS